MKRSLIAVTVFALAAVPLASVAGATPTSLSGLSGAQIVQVTTKAALAQHAMTRKVSADFLGVTLNSTVTTTLSGGVAFGSVQGHKIETVYLNGVAYVRLDKAAAAIYFGSKGAKLANKWISFTKNHTGYADFSQGMTLPAMCKILSPGGALTVTGPSTVDGQQVLAVAGDLTGQASSTQGTATLYVSTVAPFLPVKLVMFSPLTGTSTPLETIVFKNWGLGTTVVRPSVFTPSWKTAIGT